MMREIKFRVFGKKNKEMVGVAALAIVEEMFMPDNIEYQDFYNYDTHFYSEIMQYTGLKDKNGVEIYEGDIITHNGYDYSVVIFDDNKGAFIIDNIKDGLTSDNTYYLGNTNLGIFRVVGNIYENPELLK